MACQRSSAPEAQSDGQKREIQLSGQPASLIILTKINDANRSQPADRAGVHTQTMASLAPVERVCIASAVKRDAAEPSPLGAYANVSFYRRHHESHSCALRARPVATGEHDGLFRRARSTDAKLDWVSCKMSPAGHTASVFSALRLRIIWRTPCPSAALVIPLTVFPREDERCWKKEAPKIRSPYDFQSLYLSLSLSLRPKFELTRSSSLHKHPTKVKTCGTP